MAFFYMNLLSKCLLYKRKKKLNVKNCIHDSLLIITLILPERLNKEMKEYKIWNVASVSLKPDE